MYEEKIPMTNTVEPEVKEKFIKYWDKKENQHLIYRINCAGVLAQEENDNVPVYKQGNKLIKKLTQDNNIFYKQMMPQSKYIPICYRGNKRMQLANGDR